nr:DEAD/DEAH box helicase [Irregularibacter muris]
MNMMKNFGVLGINREMSATLAKNGIKEPTPIQVKTIPVLMKGLDVIAQAQTGTGKTLAFMLPIIEKIDANKPFIQALIVTPTRELAIQITSEAKKLVANKDIKILSAYGGQDVEGQIRKLKKDIHIVIGTPGRLLDHLRRKTINIGKVSMLVLDEADQMLHMGFLNEVEDIIRQTPRERQTMFFSATMPKGVGAMATRYMNQPVQIQVQSERIILDEIRQIVIKTTDRKKQGELCMTIDKYRPFMAIIFCRTKRRVSALNYALGEKGYNVEELHGDLSQAKRERVMKAFRKADIQLLVATDVAARGLDIEGVTHVFNYDMPQDTEGYIHRIGRTGRAGEKGVAITFATLRDDQMLNSIEKEIGMNLEKISSQQIGEKSNDDKAPSHGTGKNKKYNKIAKFSDKRRQEKSWTKDKKSGGSQKQKIQGKKRATRGRNR